MKTLSKPILIGYNIQYGTEAIGQDKGIKVYGFERKEL